jgi:hypothetical protein
MCRFVEEYIDFINKQIRLIILEPDQEHICKYSKLKKTLKNIGFRSKLEGKLIIFSRK